jgi:hypothetical protein
MTKVRLIAAAAAMLAYLCGAPSFAGDKVVLITNDEAARPSPPGGGELARRGITRGPLITQVDPAPGHTAVKSPMHLMIKFEGRGGATIDTSAVKVTYMKSPAIDLTDRVKPYLKDGGIDIGEAELPPGNHLIRVDVKDSEGRVTTSLLNLTVAK